MDGFKEWLQARKYSTNYIKHLILLHKIYCHRYGNVMRAEGIQHFLGISNNHMRRAYINLYLEYSNKKQLAIFIIKPRGRRKSKVPKYLTKAEVVTLIEALPKKEQKILIELMFETGLRISEALGLRLMDIDLHNCKVRGIGKGNKEFEKDISPRIKADIQDHLIRDLKPQDKVFSWSRHNVGYWLGKHSQIAIGRKVTPHQIRHSTATYLMNEGINLKTIQSYMRHSDIASTSIYTHITNQDIKEAFKKIINPLELVK